MTCVKDMAFHVLYGSNNGLAQFYVLQSMERLGAEWEIEEYDPYVAQALFFLLLDRDIVLKESVLKGIISQGIDPMPPRKAECFFLNLREEVIEPWLCNERLDISNFLDKVALLYLSV